MSLFDPKSTKRFEYKSTTDDEIQQWIDDRDKWIAKFAREEEKVRILTETIEWVAQTIHQAHHDIGVWKDCRKNTCDGIKQSLTNVKEMEGK